MYIIKNDEGKYFKGEWIGSIVIENWYDDIENATTFMHKLAVDYRMGKLYDAGHDVYAVKIDDNFEELGIEEEFDDID